MWTRRLGWESESGRERFVGGQNKWLVSFEADQFWAGTRFGIRSARMREEGDQAVANGNGCTRTVLGVDDVNREGGSGLERCRRAIVEDGKNGHSTDNEAEEGGSDSSEGHSLRCKEGPLSHTCKPGSPGAQASSKRVGTGSRGWQLAHRGPPLAVATNDAGLDARHWVLLAGWSQDPWRARRGAPLSAVAGARLFVCVAHKYVTEGRDSQHRTTIIDTVPASTTASSLGLSEHGHHHFPT